MHNGVPRSCIEFGNYASSYRNAHIHGVSFNEQLLKPLCVGVDPEIQKIRVKEKEEMKSLNDQFACLIDQVRCLEQRNKVLVTKWNLLQEHTPPLRRDLEPLFEHAVYSLRKHLDSLLSEKEQMEPRLCNVKKSVEEFKCKECLLSCFLPWQIDCLQSAICDTEQRGDCSLKDAQEKQDELHSTLQKSKDELACMLRNYQELLNDKLALDIEIATYKSLLEGEENRIFAGNFGDVVVLPNPSKGVDSCGREPGYRSLCGGYNSSRSEKHSFGYPGKGKYPGDMDDHTVGGPLSLLLAAHTCFLGNNSSQLFIMTQQMSAARTFIRGSGFSSRSAAYGLGGHKTYAASVRYPVRSGYGVPAFTSQSLANMGGSRRISHGGYGGYGAGCSAGYNYGHGGYDNLGFGGTMGHYGPRTYDSTRSCGPFRGYSNSGGESIHRVRMNEKLLKPLHVGVDPQDHEIRNHEKEEMKNLNNQFACFIEKVRILEQENKALETKWNLLQQYAMVPKKNLGPYYENFISNIKNQIDCLLHDREHLTSENTAIQHLVEEFKSKYEEEFKRRTTAENEFVLLKKDVDSISLSKTELEGKVDLLRRELEFRRGVYMEELTQLGGQISDMNILLQMDNSRDLDVDLIIKNTEAWYQNIAQRSKEEVNALYGNRFQELQEQRAKYLNDLKINQHEIEELTRVTHKLQSEHDSIKKQVGALQTSICEVEQHGDHALKDAQEKHSDLQAALQKAKDDLASMLKDYHDLLSVKMALDIEIATYKTLLEGEEIRLHTGNPFRIGRGYNPGYGGGYTTGGHRNHNQSYSSRSVGDYSRPADSNNAATGHGSADAEFYPRGANSSRGVSYSARKPNFPI
ncbi:hypothetical protein JD844_010956, partial [Phrynosoma platyrhinos]